MQYNTENKPKNKSLKIIYGIFFLLGIIAIGSYVYNSYIEVEKPVVKSTINPEKSDFIGQVIDYNGHVTVFRTHAIEGTKELVADKHNLLTTAGKTFIRTQLIGANASNTTTYIAVSNSASVPDAGWIILPSEITTNGFVRNVTGTVTNNGTSGFNITANFTATDTQSAQLTGLHWNGVSNSEGNLFAALQFTQQNMLVNDHLEIVWQVFFQ